MGRVKDFYWDEICSEQYSRDIGPEPDELEMLQADAEQAADRLQNALKRASKGEVK